MRGRAHHLATVVLRLYGPTYDPQTFQTVGPGGLMAPPTLKTGTVD